MDSTHHTPHPAVEPYRGDAELARLLKAAGIDRDVAGVRELLRGVRAAPEDVDPGHFLSLFGRDLPEELAAQLAALKSLIEAPPPPQVGDIAARVAALRAELARMDLDGFVIPRADEFQGEYVPARSERLAWITGFTGSAGVAVVLRDRAAVFVDGRYTLQAEAQVSASLYERHHLTETFHGDWIAGIVKKGGRIGYDPWLHTVGWIDRMKAALGRAGADLVAVDTNPLDAIWHDRPSAPLGPVVAQALAQAGQSSADKRAEIAAELKRNGELAAVLTQPDGIAWLLNIRGGDVPNTPLPLSYALLTNDGDVDLFIDSRKLVPGLEVHLGNQVSVRKPEELRGALEAIGATGGKVRVDPVWTASWVFDRLTEAGARVVKERDPTVFRKAAKNTVEIAGTRAAHARDGVAVTRFLHWLSGAAAASTLTEIEASDRLFEFRKEQPLFRGTSFDSISGAGPNGAIVHYRAAPETNRVLEKDSVYLIDSGGQYLDGTTDITRTVAVGTPPADAKRHFTLVLKGHIALATLRFPKGTTGSQIDILARQFLWAQGLDYDHGTGHGVGSFLSVHEESARIAKAPNAVAMVPGMILSNEPGYYRAGEYGIRIENLVLVRPAADIPGGDHPMMAFETLTLAPIDRNLIEPSLLTEAEKAWLNAYHARVAEKVGPHLEADAAAWLATATAPI
ncbi:aminopeptidase P family protein [Nitrospirillum sp. BR 11164]|uniref:aminopeptidase P family protein n=1 Tax=Nitrospirillum sp. BR 11164 TaxID=3104324 RepID=UPI002AFE84AD|nr:aminopeptidase P family protein [Nitrospirillum sp. BR 11164]MEA1650429.1 aminopeptidase P family protein [Nitrospirillum sp. BR 11164]